VTSRTLQGSSSKKVATLNSTRNQCNANVVDLADGKVVAIISQSNHEASKDPSLSNRLAHAMDLSSEQKVLALHWGSGSPLVLSPGWATALGQRFDIGAIERFTSNA
jgi:hypothetical protein